MTTPKAARKNALRNAKKDADKSGTGPAANIGGGAGVPTRPRVPKKSA